MASSSDPKAGVDLSSVQTDLAPGLAAGLRVASGLLLLLAALKLGAGVLQLFQQFWPALLSILTGAVLGFMGLVLWTGAGDARYLAETRGYEREHLANVCRSLTVAFQALLILAGLLGLVLLLRLVF